MRKGKLTPSELKSAIIDVIKNHRQEVQIHAGIGEDCSAISCNGFILITSDPITAKCNNPGKLAIFINANDIAASGGEPLAVTMTIIAPMDYSVEDIKSIMMDAESAAKELDIEIVGGHTEFSDAVNRVIVSSTMLGKVVNPISSTGAKPNDSIILTKYAAIEGTLILSEHCNDIANRFSDEINWMNDNLSVIEEGRIASTLNISSMHDVTEGGVLGAVKEMCEENKLGATINVEAIPVKQSTIELCRRYDINPYKLISSGSMIITTSEPNKLIEKLGQINILATEIGTIDISGNVIAKYSNKIEDVIVEADELLKISEGIE